MAPRTAARYDKTSPSFADAIALVRRHLWVQQGTFMPSEREHESIKVPRLLYHRMLDTLVVHQFWIDGYRDFNLMRASAVVKRQSTRIASWLR